MKPLPTFFHKRSVVAELPLINTPLQRGDYWTRRRETVSTVFTGVGKPLKRFTTFSRANTPLKRGVNETPFPQPEGSEVSRSTAQPSCCL